MSGNVVQEMWFVHKHFGCRQQVIKEQAAVPVTGYNRKITNEKNRHAYFNLYLRIIFFRLGSSESLNFDINTSQSKKVNFH